MATPLHDGDIRALLAGAPITPGSLLNLERIDFAACLKHAEPLLVAAGRLGEWAPDGNLDGNGGLALYWQRQKEFRAFEAAVAETGILRQGILWWHDDNDDRRYRVAQALRQLIDDGKNGSANPVAFAQRLAVTVELLREVTAQEPAAGGGGIPGVAHAANQEHQPDRQIVRDAVEQIAPASRAIAMMLQADKTGQKMTVKEIAKAVGRHPSVLYRDAQFRASRSALKAQKQGQCLKGSKNKSGNVEAGQDPADE